MPQRSGAENICDSDRNRTWDRGVGEYGDFPGRLYHDWKHIVQEDYASDAHGGARRDIPSGSGK